jgi:hypothetical protein
MIPAAVRAVRVLPRILKVDQVATASVNSGCLVMNSLALAGNLEQVPRKTQGTDTSQDSGFQKRAITSFLTRILQSIT